ncbi:MAG: SdrD B-like domain-containing protein, partial [Coleofasciculus sp. C2-GNP5-27]
MYSQIAQVNKTLKGWLKCSRSFILLILGICIFTLSLPATAAHSLTDSVLDLSQLKGKNSGFVNSAYILRADLASGSGTNSSFLRLKATPEEEGYNTDATVSQPDVNFARSLQLSELQQVTIAGETFREIRLDLNERNRASEIVLQELRLFLGNSPTLSGYNPSNQTLTGALNGGQAVFDLGKSVLFDAALTSGSGSGDALFYVPESDFAGADGSTYVYLFAKLGSADKINGSEAGFEEFAVADIPGIEPNGEISGTTFNDINGNGIYDVATEPPLEGLTINLYLDDGDSKFDEQNHGLFDPNADSLVTKTMSAADGSYEFTRLLPGDYFVEQKPIPENSLTTPNPIPSVIGSSTIDNDNNFGNRQEEVDVEVVKTFTPTYEGENVFIPGEAVSYTLTVTNNGLATAESVLINDPGNLQLDVSQLILPVGAIDLDTYDPNQDGILDSYLTANGQSLTGDGDTNTIDVVIPSLLSGESVELTVNATVSSAYVETSNVYASLGDDNSTLSEYYNAHIKGTNWLPINGIEKKAGSSWVLIKQNIVGSNASASSYSNAVDTNSNNDVSANLGSYGVIPFARYSATLGNGEQLTIHSKLFDPQTDDPQNPEFIYALNADLCWNNYTQSYDYSISDAQCLSLEQSDPAQWRFDNNSTFLPAADEGMGDVNLTWNNKALIEQIPNEWNAFLALDTSNDPTAAEQIVDFYRDLVKRVLVDNSTFESGELRVMNLNTNQSEMTGVADAQILSSFADNVMILVKSDGVYYTDETLTAGTQIIAQNDLQSALDDLEPTPNPLSRLKIVIDSSVTTTRLTTLDLNSLQDKGYLATDLEILGKTMTFNTKNGQGDIDLSQLNVIAPAQATVKLKGSNGADTIKGSVFSEIIEGSNSGDELI